jgi:AraC-like DNA-binding protein
MGVLLSTQHVQKKERLSYWTDLVSNSFIRCEVKALDDRPFNGFIHTDQLAFVQFSEVSSNRSHVKRTKQDISRVSKGYVKILFQVSGESILMQDGRTAHLRPGNWTIGDCTRPYDLILTTDNYKQFVVQVPQHLLLSRLSDFETMAAYAFSSQAGLGKVTFDLIRSTKREMNLLNPHATPRLAETLLDLIVANLREYFSPNETGSRNGTITLLEIKSFIHEQLSNPQLSVDLIANKLNLSKSYLHFLFKEEEITVSRYIWDMRLEKCRNALADIRQINRSITDIAFAWGFNSVTHFSSAFKTRFGLSPRAYRNQQLELVS